MTEQAYRLVGFIGGPLDGTTEMIDAYAKFVQAGSMTYAASSDDPDTFTPSGLSTKLTRERMKFEREISGV